MKQFWERIVDLFPGKKTETAKYVLLAVAAGILFLWSGDLFGLVSVRQAPQAAPSLAAEPVTKDELARYEEDQEHKLKAILSQIQGAGAVDVKLSVESGPSLDVITDTRKETTKQTEQAHDNSTRNTETISETETHVIQKGGASDAPVVAKRSRPVIAGVLVVAEGAWNAEVKARLLESARIQLAIPANRIIVQAAGRGGH
jgi:stage III sporulation protein AG